MATIFSKIVAGEIPCYKVAETEHCFAFLDINPVVKGHVLCIPKQEVDYIFDLDDELFCELHLFAKKVAKGLKKVCPCIKVGEAVVGIKPTTPRLSEESGCRKGGLEKSGFLVQEAYCGSKLCNNLNQPRIVITYNDGCVVGNTIFINNR